MKATISKQNLKQRENKGWREETKAREKTVVNKQITDQEFPAEASVMKKVYQPYRRGWTV